MCINPPADNELVSLVLYHVSSEPITSIMRFMQYLVSVAQERREPYSGSCTPTARFRFLFSGRVPCCAEHIMAGLDARDSEFNDSPGESNKGLVAHFTNSVLLGIYRDRLVHNGSICRPHRLVCSVPAAVLSRYRCVNCSELYISVIV